MKIQGTKIRGLKLYSSAATVEPDSYFNLVSLLLPGNGTNGAQNNTFLDSSSNALTVTRNGNTTQGTFSPFSQTGWSNYFDGSGDYLTVADNAVLDMGSSSFTIEFWTYPTVAAPSSNAYFGKRLDSNTYGGINLYVNANGTVNLLATVNGSTWGINLITSNSININQWNHIAVVRDGNVWTVYVNGTSGGSTTVSGTVPDNANAFAIGAGASNGEHTVPAGYLSNFRVVKGTAVYTSAFTPPTSALTAITNTSLLTCQSSRFMDNSANAFAITVAGNTAVQAFAPFDPTAAYSAASVGGSAYLDGSGDYLTISNPASLLTFGTGDFTVECFVYPTVGSSSAYVCWIYGNTIDIVAISVNSNTGAVTFTLRGTNLSQTTVVGSTGLVRLNEWTHLALVRTGTNFYGYVNGTRFSTTIAANAAFNEAQAQFFTQPQIGASSNPVGNYFTGYVSGWRALKGTALYTAATITVPSAPLTDIANTSALLNSTNGGITDAAAKNVLETVGSAQISTAQSKWGGSSMLFDKTDDRLAIPSSQNYNFGTGDFTIEFWMYSNDVSGATTRGILQTSDTAGGLKTTYTSGLCIFQGSTATGSAQNGALVANIIGTSVGTNAGGIITAGTWYHIAVVRSSGVCTVYVNGTAQPVTATISGAISGQNLVVGGYYNTSYLYDGYINDLRITKGYARYTANFTAPTAAFPTQ